MKIIDVSNPAQTVTFLPEEILEVILKHCQQGKTHQALQRDLNSFCLVSRDWYAAGIKHLYSFPLLTARNFGQFANTICPTTSNRSRRVGLEHFVEHIDMGGLAYESKASTTSRLLSRTKTSLKTFVAPTVSFSTTCLAPLSKCVQLQHLDLSHDVYDFNFTSLARTLSQLQNIAWLSLPKRRLHMYDQDVDALPSSIWSTSLEYLQVNENVPDMAFDTSPRTFFQTLPASLKRLRLKDVEQYRSMSLWMNSPVKLPQVTEVSISVLACEDEQSLCRLLQPFPNVQKVTVSAMTTWLMKEFLSTYNNNTWTITVLPAEDSAAPPQELELLILEASPDYPSSDHLRLSMLEAIVTACPRLLRMEVPAAYLFYEDPAFSVHFGILDELNRLMAQRAKAMKQNKTGLGLEDCGIFIDENVLQGVGLKRSFRSRTDGGA